MRSFAPALLVAALATFASAAPIVMSGSSVSLPRNNVLPNLDGSSVDGAISPSIVVTKIEDALQGHPVAIKRDPAPLDAGPLSKIESSVLDAITGKIKPEGSSGSALGTFGARDVVGTLETKLKGLIPGLGVIDGITNHGSSLGTRASPSEIESTVSGIVNGKLGDLKGRTMTTGGSVIGDLGAVGASLGARAPLSGTESMTESSVVSDVESKLKDALQGRPFNGA